MAITKGIDYGGEGQSQAEQPMKGSRCTVKKHVCIGPPPTGHWRDVERYLGMFAAHVRWWKQHLKDLKAGR